MQKLRVVTMKIYQQYHLRDLFTPIFLYEKKILEGGEIVYVEVDRTPRTTGIEAFDDFLRVLEKGVFDNDAIASTMSVNREYLNGLVWLLVGKSMSEFIRAYQFHIFDLYLRYTRLTGKAIAEKLGLGTASNFSQRIFTMHGQTLWQRRNHLREHGDVGRFLFQPPTEQEKKRWAQ